MIEGWQAEALNTAPDSQNQIHGDEMAKAFGFKGGLVPGVTISAYLVHPAVITWGMDFLTCGKAHVKVGKPLYDEEIFRVDIDQQDETRYHATLVRPDDTPSATAEVELNREPLQPPVRRGDPVATRDYQGEAASFTRWQQLKENGCTAFRYHWNQEHRMHTYVRDMSLMPEAHSPAKGFANMGYLLGISNWVLAGNAYMNPWVHLETRSQNYQPVAPGTTIIAEMTVADFYEKKGHEFVDADIALFNETDDSCLCSIQLRAIYKLRGA